MYPSYRMLLYSLLSTKYYNFSTQHSDNQDNQNENLIIFLYLQNEDPYDQIPEQTFRLTVPSRPFLTHPVL